MENFFGKKILFVIAHPDDESFTVAGTIHKNHMLGGKNYIICATMGEKGKSHLKKPMSEAQLKKTREQELTKATKFLKVDGLYFFNLPDTKVLENINKLTEKMEPLIKKITPDYTFGFGSDGWSGHVDHIASGNAAKKLSKKLKIPFIAYSAPPEFVKSFKEIKTRRKHGRYAAKIVHLKPNIKIPVNPKVKIKSFQSHKSQFGNSTMLIGFPKATKKAIITYEYFRK